MKVRAKFIVEVLSTQNDHTAVRLSAVTTGSEENKSFAKYTPAAYIHMSISHETPAHGAFSVGQEVYVDFTPIEKE